MEMNGFYSKGRIITFAVITGIFILAVLVSYGMIMLKPFSQPLPSVITRERGAILDRNGKILAIQTTVYNLSVTPSAVKDVDNCAKILSPIIGISAEKIADQINQVKDDPKKDFLYLKKRINQAEHDEIADAVQSCNLYGLRMEKTVSRSYPENSLAAQLIGFMGDDGTGLSGIEYSCQSVLAPPEDITKVNTYGKNVLLTIDSNLQFKLEQIAGKAMEDTQAESLMLVAAEAKTGEILSYISLPAPNLNYYRSSSPEEQMNRPAMYAYEPGSVFKIFSVASFLDAGVITPDETFLCDGVFEIKTANGEHIRMTCLEHHGLLTARGALQYSCNDALAQMSQKINSEYFLQQLRDFGFGSKTGIELPGETKGSVKNTTDKLWSGRSKPTISIGQEISVSALQMVQAATAVANGGKPVQLTVISKIVDKNGNTVFQHVPQEKEPVISKKTADYILSCMETTAVAGTGSRANIGDVSIGVKTGTAQMLDPEKGGYSDTDFLSNCVAVFPVEDPEIILYIVITKAKGETYAGRIVAPVIHEAANAIIDYLGLQRSSAVSLRHSGKIEIPVDKPIVIEKVIPDFTGYPKRMLTGLLDRKDLNIVIKGEGWVVSQNPPPGTPVRENMVIELNLE